MVPPYGVVPPPYGGIPLSPIAPPVPQNLNYGGYYPPRLPHAPSPAAAAPAQISFGQWQGPSSQPSRVPPQGLYAQQDHGFSTVGFVPIPQRLDANGFPFAAYVSQLFRLGSLPVSLRLADKPSKKCARNKCGCGKKKMHCAARVRVAVAYNQDGTRNHEFFLLQIKTERAHALHSNPNFAYPIPGRT